MSGRRYLAGVVFAASLLLLGGCSWWFASMEALVWYAALPGSQTGFVFDGSGSTAKWTRIRDYRWDFGDGNTGTGATTTHIYASEGTYTVSLTIGNGAGLLATDSASVTVRAAVGNQPPAAAFTVVPSSGPAPLTVVLDASDSFDADGSIASYAWDFGDGTASAGVSASHTYADPGTYTLTLEVTDDDGSTDFATETVRVTGNGEPQNRPPTASFTAAPTDGEAPLFVAFDGAGSADADGEIVSYSWNFGDGATLTDGNDSPSHVFATAGVFNVRLTVTDDDGAADTATRRITVTAPAGPANAAPNASFTADPASGDAPLDVEFDAGLSSDPDGSIAAYHWEFGDGDVLQDGGVAPSHTYATPGTYPVTLTVVDDDGAADSATRTVTVTSPAGPTNVAPNASFTTDPDPAAGVAPLDVDFDASGSSDADGTIVTYSWDYGDGATGAGVTSSHRYEEPDDYVVTLTVEDDDGATDSTTRTIMVVGLPPTP